MASGERDGCITNPIYIVYSARFLYIISFVMQKNAPVNYIPNANGRDRTI